MKKRVFLIVLDSLGIGRQVDAALFGDEGSNTLSAISKSPAFQIPNLQKMGLLSIDGVAEDVAEIQAAAGELSPTIQKGISVPDKDMPVCGAYGRLAEISMGKDTTIGHWELSGIVSKKALPVYPGGFPDEIIQAFENKTGRRTLCNQPYSGTEVIHKYGEEHIRTGALIVYTSADSVFQIAAHEDIVPIQELYRYCEIAREILCGEHAVGRVIARPFTGDFPAFERTKNRHDFSLLPPGNTILDVLSRSGKDVISVGKIADIFGGRGVTESIKTSGNADGIEKIIALTKKDFQGLCFINLVDFDMLYGHRNDVDGYAAALRYFDKHLPDIMARLLADDILIITADHGNIEEMLDPNGKPQTAHSTNPVPVVVLDNEAPKRLRSGGKLGDIAPTILSMWGVPLHESMTGKSLLEEK